jgi:preprotein translocase subunit SecG
MKFPSRREWPAPLLLLAFTGVAVAYFNAVFTTSSRWVALALVLLLALRERSLRSLFRTAFMRISIVFMGWALVTYLWSEVPELSLMKAVALALVILAGTGAGYLWVRHHPLESAIAALAPMSFMVLAAAVLGLDTMQNPDAPEGLTMYQGLTGNSNMFGTLCVMAFPFAAWKYSCAPSTRWRHFWGAFALLLTAFTLLSNSRAAIGVVLFAGLGLFGAPGVRKFLPKAIFVFVAFGLLVMVMPDTVRDLENRFVYKSDREGGVTSSRDEAWATSYEQALKGGLIGGGYGVTIGALESFEGSLTTTGYGREKANSQLGIMEETGLVGLALYLGSTFSLFATLWLARWRCREPRMRKLMGLMFGMLAGLTFQSVFEAWYNAPGSPECMYYWIMAGIAVGLATDPRLHSASSIQKNRRGI